MPIEGQVLVALLIASVISMYFALRLGAWAPCLLVVFLSLPIALVANVPYFALLLLPLSQLAMAIALRWSLAPAGWLLLLALATGIWFVGVMAPILYHWSWSWVVLRLGLLAGLVALALPRAPWELHHPGGSN